MLDGWVEGGATPEHALAVLTAHGLRPRLVVVAASGERDPFAVPGFRHVLFDGGADYWLAGPFVPLAHSLIEPSAERRAERDALAARLALAEASAARWRASSLAGWQARASTSAPTNAQQELFELKRSYSWRITRPLRGLNRRLAASLKR
jgi:hypothetical protein